MTLHIIVISIGTALVAAVATAGVRRYALRRDMVDVPNGRSSHLVPTPRGGGLAIVTALSVAIGVSLFLDWISANLFLALTGGGLLVALTGWIDDHRSLSPSTRLISHFAAGLWAVYWVGGLSTARIGIGELHLGAAGPVLGVVGLVWLLNLYNFMDGIDGLAAVEGVMVGVGGAILAAMTATTDVAIVSLLIGCASAGFMIWNWAPARIFMGDIGSGFLGYVIGVTALASDEAGGPSLIIWLLLLGVFIFDATVTLVRRTLNRERLSTAHRRHAYQRAVQAGRSHAEVTATVAVINLSLFGLALTTLLNPRWIWLVLCSACALLIAVYSAVEQTRPMFRDERDSDPVPR